MTLLERMLRHDAASTRALLALSTPLPDSALDRDFDIGHRTLRRTFSHIIDNMECWHDLMAARPQRWTTHSPAPFPTIPSLLTRLDTVASDLLTLGTHITTHQLENDLFTDYLDSPPRRKPLGAALLHVTTHGMHHRAQCLHILRRLNVPNPPEGDALTWERTHRNLPHWPPA